MKSRSYTVYVVLTLAALALWFVRPAGRVAETNRAASPTKSGPVLEPTTAGDKSPPALTTGTVGSTPLPAGTQTAVARNSLLNANDSNPSSNQAAQIDVDRVRHMVSDYHTLMGENPVGTNAEIMKQMIGGNSHQAMLGPPEGMALNGQGELIDQWGTPFFFHQLSRDKMEVRSAGPDKVMWTTDDVIAR